MQSNELRSLADRIDHKQLWAQAELYRRELPATDQDAYAAGVELRRLASVCDALGLTSTELFKIAVRMKGRKPMMVQMLHRLLYLPESAASS